MKSTTAPRAGSIRETVMKCQREGSPDTIYDDFISLNFSLKKPVLTPRLAVLTHTLTLYAMIAHNPSDRIHFSSELSVAVGPLSALTSSLQCSYRARLRYGRHTKQCCFQSAQEGNAVSLSHQKTWDMNLTLTRASERERERKGERSWASSAYTGYFSRNNECPG